MIVIWFDKKKIASSSELLPVPHVDEGEGAVEGGHEDVRHGQVKQEVVGHAPHAAVS